MRVVLGVQKFVRALSLIGLTLSLPALVMAAPIAKKKSASTLKIQPQPKKNGAPKLASQKKSTAQKVQTLAQSAHQSKTNHAGFQGPMPQDSASKSSTSNQLTTSQVSTVTVVKTKKTQKVTAFRSIEATEQQAALRADGSVKTVSGMVFVTHAQSLYDYQDGSKRASQSLLMNLMGRINDDYTLIGRLSASRDLQDTESDASNGVSDLFLVLAKRHSNLQPWLRGGYSLTSVLGTSRFSQVYQNFYGNIGATYTFSLTNAVLAEGFMASLTLGANRNFHQFETDKAGRILNEYGLREILSTGYSIGSFVFSFEFVHRHAWNYQGAINQAFEHTEEVTYFINPSWSVALGHTNGGSWLAPNGRDSNLRLIDQSNSMVYSSMSLAF